MWHLTYWHWYFGIIVCIISRYTKKPLNWHPWTNAYFLFDENWKTWALRYTAYRQLVLWCWGYRTYRVTFESGRHFLNRILCTQDSNGLVKPACMACGPKLQHALQTKSLIMLLCINQFDTALVKHYSSHGSCYTDFLLSPSTEFYILTWETGLCFLCFPIFNKNYFLGLSGYCMVKILII